MWLTRAGFFLVVLLMISAIFYILKTVLVKKGKQFFSSLSSVSQAVNQVLIKNEEIQKFTKSHKILFQFIRGRLNKNSFFGLPLTLLCLVLIYVLSLFGGIIEDIINADLIVLADIRIANLLAVFRNARLTKFFFWITLLGKWQVILIFTIAAILILWLWKKRSYIMPLLLCIAGSEILTSAGKLIFHRVRPAVAIYPENSFSFPSGHAAVAIAFYGFLTYMIIRNANQWNKKINSFFAGLILIILIGFSRLYLNVHYISDVWGGYLAGAIWLIAAISFSEYFLYKKQKNGKLYPKTKKRLATIGIVLASMGLYIIFAQNYQMPALALPQEANQITTNDAMAIFETNQLKYTENIVR